MHKQQHHVVPLCMKGIDHETNLEPLTPDKHNTVHSTLNIDHRELRNFRKRTNAWTMWNGERSGVYHKLWKRYFANIDELPEELVLIHGRSFSRQIARSRKQILSLLKGLGNEPLYENFDMELLDYHSPIEKHGELIENVEWKLFNLMKMDREKNDLFVEYYLSKKPNLGLNRPEKG